MCDLYSFFFHSYRPPRDLHSFPTRRSSDLCLTDGNCSAACPLPDTDADCPKNCLADGLCAFGTCGDRKSTRLNSSHQIISYAVFCLKKKKKKNKHKPKLVKHIHIYL